MNPIDRNKRIVELYASGETLGDIGHEFGLTRERVRQIVEQLGGPEAEIVRAQRTDREAAVAHAALADFMEHFGGIARTLSETGFTREQTAARIVLLHPEVHRATALEMLTMSGIIFDQTPRELTPGDAELQAGLWFLVGSDQRIEPNLERAAIDLPDIILDAVTRALHNARVAPADIAAILGVIAAARDAAFRNPRMTISIARYEELRLEQGAALGLESVKGQSPWPPPVKP
jgi:hypothetical protein